MYSLTHHFQKNANWYVVFHIHNFFLSFVYNFFWVFFNPWACFLFLNPFTLPFPFRFNPCPDLSPFNPCPVPFLYQPLPCPFPHATPGPFQRLRCPLLWSQGKYQNHVKPYCLSSKIPCFYHTMETRGFSRGLRGLRGKLKKKMNFWMNVFKINKLIVFLF